jgi:hypothetical protein
LIDRRSEAQAGDRSYARFDGFSNRLLVNVLALKALSISDIKAQFIVDPY